MAKKTENQNNEGLKSLYLELENFKQIDKKVIDIGGRSLIFLGKNESGKSTLIQAMMSPMDSKLLPTEPIKKGEERARIRHVIGGNLNGEKHEYTLDLYFTPSNNKGRLVVLNENGEQIKSPATMIKNIIGNVSFDVMKWLSEPKEKKLKIIKSLTGCGVELDLIAKDIKEKKDSMKVKKDRAEELEGALKNHEFAQGEVEKYSTQIDITPIQEELRNIAGKQNQWDGVKSKTEGFVQEISLCEQSINSSAAKINELQAEIKRHQANIEEKTKLADIARENYKKGTEWLEKVPRPTIDAVNDKLSEAMAHNEKFNRVNMLSGQHKEMVKLKVEADNIKREIEGLENKRSQVIQNSQLPIEGLSFSDDEIFINGLPLEEEQINTATLFDIGVEVAMALNPNLKIIFLHDGSLFDREHLKKIVKKIEDNGYMAVIEMVDYEGGELEVKYTEDYLK